MVLYLSFPVHLGVTLCPILVYPSLSLPVCLCLSALSLSTLSLCVLHMLIHLCVGATFLLPESRRLYFG